MCVGRIELSIVITVANQSRSSEMIICHIAYVHMTCTQFYVSLWQFLCHCGCFVSL